MSLTEGEDEAEGFIGLSFEPTEDRGVPDVSGVLWVNPENAELQWLDYGYEFLDVPGSERLGGKIRFEGLPGGTWIVREWYIRMPLLTFSGARRPSLFGLKEEGGLVMRLSSTRGDGVHDSEEGIIEGVVLDPDGAEPVEEVVVLLDDSASVVTDRDGRFQFATLAEGYYGLRVLNPVLDPLGFSTEPVFLEVNPGGVTSARLQSISLDAVYDMMTERCGYSSFSKYEGILAGFARLYTGGPALGGQISVWWREALAGSVGPEVRVWTPPLTTTDLSEDGVFLLCGVPQDRPVEIKVEWNGIESPPAVIRLSEDQRLSRADVTVPGGP